MENIIVSMHENGTDALIEAEFSVWRSRFDDIEVEFVAASYVKDGEPALLSAAQIDNLAGRAFDMWSAT